MYHNYRIPRISYPTVLKRLISETVTAQTQADSLQPLQNIRFQESIQRQLSQRLDLDKIQESIQLKYDHLIANSQLANQDHDEISPLVRLNNKEIEIYNVLTDILAKAPVLRTVDTNKWSRFPRQVDLLPPVPSPLTRDSINEYVKQLSQINVQHYSKSPEILNSVSFLYESLTNSSMLTVDSFNLIISFFARNYMSLSCFRIRDRMIQLGVQPNVETMNIFISLTFKKQKYNESLIQLDNVLENIKIIRDLKIGVNYTTFYILFNGFKNNKVKDQLLDKMLELKVPMKPISTTVAQHEFDKLVKTTDNSSNVDVRNAEFIDLTRSIIKARYDIDYKNPKIVSIFVSQYLSPSSTNTSISSSDICERLDKAWSLITQSIKQNPSKTDHVRSVDPLFDYFITNNQIYNCIALMNFIESQFPRSSNSIYHWHLILQKLVKLNKVKHPNWSPLAKKIYQNGNRYNTEQKSKWGSSLLRKENLDSINEYGRDIHDMKFDVRSNYNTVIEQILVEESFKNLNWVEKPIFKLEDNSLEFQKSAKWFS